MRFWVLLFISCVACGHYSASQELTPECNQNPKSCLPECRVLEFGGVLVDYSDGHPSRQTAFGTVEPAGGDFVTCEPD
ncbi:MAG: hypothetical protein AAFZ38_01885 [Myxococcota bacterium]